MDFLYQEAITQNNLTDCPPATYKPIDRVLFRAVFPEGHKRAKSNFSVKPARVNSNNTNDYNCELLALSFFETEEQCRKHIIFIKEEHDFILGTHIAEVKIIPDYGVAQVPPREDGHINFHPFKAVQWEIVSPLIDI